MPKLQRFIHFQLLFNNICNINKRQDMNSKLKWSPEEENILRKLADIQSKRKWVEIAKQINAFFPEKQRTSKQCREKYINHVQYGQGTDCLKWTEEEQQVLFKEYLLKGSQWKLISSLITGKSQNAIKNKFYGKIRKLVRKLNNICKERINRSNKPLRDQSIMRIIDIKEGFENLPEHLVLQSNELKNQLFSLAQKDMNEFEKWDLIQQNNVVTLIKKIHKFNINSRYYCSRKRKTGNHKKHLHHHTTKVEQQSILKQETLIKVQSPEKFQNYERLVQPLSFKLVPTIPIIIEGHNYISQLWH